MNKKERSENRKALPKFFGIILSAMLVGGLVGFFSSYYGGMMTTDQMVEQIYGVIRAVTPWAMWILTLGFVAGELVLYQKAKKQFAGWDGEDEDLMDEVDRKLNWLLLLTTLQLLTAFLLHALSQLVGTDRSFLVTILGFIAAIACCIVMQQKAVDLTKAMNPEKKGSVYDMKFQEKWLESCDENERRQIGQAAYQSFKATTGACIVLWVVLLLLGNVLDVGILPVLSVMVIWAVSHISFHIEAMKLSRHK